MSTVAARRPGGHSLDTCCRATQLPKSKQRMQVFKVASTSLQHDLPHNKADWSKLQSKPAALHAFAVPARDQASPMPAAGPPKGISKLLTVTNSGHMRSPPLVERFRRAKENVLRAVTAPPPDADVNNKLMTLEAMFHQVWKLRSSQCDAVM